MLLCVFSVKLCERVNYTELNRADTEVHGAFETASCFKVGIMGFIRLEDLEFYAFHGCYKEEQIAGTRFLVNLLLETNTDKPSTTDNILDALNYQEVYKLVKQEMSIRSNLLEHVAGRILDTLFKHFPQLEHATVKVSKMNPPMGGAMRCVSVEMTR